MRLHGEHDTPYMLFRHPEFFFSAAPRKLFDLRAFMQVDPFVVPQRLPRFPVLPR